MDVPLRDVSAALGAEDESPIFLFFACALRNKGTNVGTKTLMLERTC